jgi:hypothetical protein
MSQYTKIKAKWERNNSKLLKAHSFGLIAIIKILYFSYSKEGGRDESVCTLIFYLDVPVWEGTEEDKE